MTNRADFVNVRVYDNGDVVVGNRHGPLGRDDRRSALVKVLLTIDVLLGRRRPVAMIQHDLDTALAFQAGYATRPPADRLAQQMRDDNEREIERLRVELAVAQADQGAPPASA